MNYNGEQWENGCPECGSTNIKKRTRTHDYKCQNPGCGVAFKRPVSRSENPERRGPPSPSIRRMLTEEPPAGWAMLDKGPRVYHYITKDKSTLCGHAIFIYGSPNPDFQPDEDKKCAECNKRFTGE